MNNDKYPIAIRLLHWLMAFIIIGLIIVGWVMQGLDKTEDIRPTLYGLHKSFGVTIALLLILRLIIRLKSIIPEPLESLPNTVKILSHYAHILLYALMFMVPVSGYMMSNMFGHSVHLFGLSLPDLFSKNKELGSIIHTSHWIIAYSLLIVVILHAAGAIKHRFFEPKENDVLRRIL